VHRGTVLGGPLGGPLGGREARDAGGGSRGAGRGDSDSRFTLWQHIATPPAVPLPDAAAQDFPADAASHSGATAATSAIVRAVSWCRCGPRQLWLAFVVGECAHLYAPLAHADVTHIAWNHVYSFRLHHYNSEIGRAEQTTSSNNDHTPNDDDVLCAATTSARCTIAWCPSGRRLLVNAGSFFMCDLTCIRREYSHVGPRGVISWSFNAPRVVRAQGRDAAFSCDGGSLFYTCCERSRCLRVWGPAPARAEDGVNGEDAEESSSMYGSYEPTLLGLRNAIQSVAWHPGGCKGSGSSAYCASSFRNARVLLVLTVDGRASLYQEESSSATEPRRFFPVANIGFHRGMPHGGRLLTSVHWVEFECVSQGAEWDATTNIYNDDTCDDSLFPRSSGLSSVTASSPRMLSSDPASSQRKRSYIITQSCGSCDGNCTGSSHASGETETMLTVWYVEGLQRSRRGAVKSGVWAVGPKAGCFDGGTTSIFSATCFFSLPPIRQASASSQEDTNTTSARALQHFAMLDKSCGLDLELPEPTRLFAMCGGHKGEDAREGSAPSWAVLEWTPAAAIPFGSDKRASDILRNTGSLLSQRRVYECFHKSRIKGMVVERPSNLAWREETAAATVANTVTATTAADSVLCVTWDDEGVMGLWDCTHMKHTERLMVGREQGFPVFHPQDCILGMDSVLDQHNSRWRAFCIDRGTGNGDERPSGPPRLVIAVQYCEGGSATPIEQTLHLHLDQLDHLLNTTSPSFGIAASMSLLVHEKSVLLAFIGRTKTSTNALLAVWTLTLNNTGSREDSICADMRRCVTFSVTSGSSLTIGFVTNRKPASTLSPSSCVVIGSSFSPASSSSANMAVQQTNLILRVFPIHHGGNTADNADDGAANPAVLGTSLPQDCVGISSLAESDLHSRIAAIAVVRDKEMRLKARYHLCVWTCTAESRQSPLQLEDSVDLKLPPFDLNRQHESNNGICCWMPNASRSGNSGAVVVAMGRHVFVYARLTAARPPVQERWICIAEFTSDDLDHRYRLPRAQATAIGADPTSGCIMVASGDKISVFSATSSVGTKNRRFTHEIGPHKTSAAQKQPRQCAPIAQLASQCGSMLPAYHPTFLQVCLFQGRYAAISAVLHGLYVRPAAADDFYTIAPQEILRSGTSFDSEGLENFAAPPPQKSNALEELFDSLSSSSFSLPGLVKEEHHELVSFVRTLIALFGKNLPISKQNMVHSGTAGLDHCGFRFFTALALYDTSKSRMEDEGIPSPSPSMMKLAHIAWAAHSESTSQLVDLCISNENISWERARSLGMGIWVQSTSLLRQVAECIAKHAFVKSGRDPYSCFLFYVLLGKVSLLSGLFRMKRDMKMADFLAKDFYIPRWGAAAIKNASKLMQQRRYELAAAFFILGGKASEAVRVCLKLLRDPQLSILVAQLCEDRDSADRVNAIPLADYPSRLLQKTIQMAIMPHMSANSQPILLSLLHWIVGEWKESLEVLLLPSDGSGSLRFAASSSSLALEQTGLPEAVDPANTIRLRMEKHDGFLFDHAMLVRIVAQRRHARKRKQNKYSHGMRRDTASAGVPLSRTDTGPTLFASSGQRDTAAGLFAGRSNSGSSKQGSDTATGLFASRNNSSKAGSDTAAGLFASRNNSSKAGSDTAAGLFASRNNSSKAGSDTAAGLFASRNNSAEVGEGTAGGLWANRSSSSKSGSDTAAGLFARNNSSKAGSDTAAGLFASRNNSSKVGSDTAAGLFASRNRDTAAGLFVNTSEDSVQTEANPFEKGSGDMREGKPDVYGNSTQLSESDTLSKGESVRLLSLERRINATLSLNGMPAIVIWNEDQANDKDPPNRPSLTNALCGIFEPFLEHTVGRFEDILWSAIVQGDTHVVDGACIDAASAISQVHQRTVDAWRSTCNAVAAQFTYIESRWGIQTKTIMVSQLRARVKAHSGSEFSDIVLILLEQQHQNEDAPPTLNMSEDSARDIVQKASEACVGALGIGIRLSRSAAPMISANDVEHQTTAMVRGARIALSLAIICDAFNLWQHAVKDAAKETATLWDTAFRALYVIYLRFAWQVQDFQAASQLLDPSAIASPFNARFLSCAGALISRRYTLPLSRMRILAGSRGDEVIFSRWVTDYTRLVLERQLIGYLESFRGAISKEGPCLSLLESSLGSLLDSWKQEIVSRACGRTQPAWFFSSVHPARRDIVLRDRIDKVFDAAVAEANEMATKSSHASALWRQLGGLKEMNYAREKMAAEAASIITPPFVGAARPRFGGEGNTQMPSCVEIVRLGEGRAVKDVCFDATDASFSRLALVGPSAFLEPNINASLQFRRRHKDFTTLVDEEQGVWSASMRVEADRNLFERSRLSNKLRKIMGDESNDEAPPAAKTDGQPGTHNDDIDNAHCRGGGGMVLPMARTSADSLKHDIFARYDLKFTRHDLDCTRQRTLRPGSFSGSKDVERPSTLSAHGSIPMFVSGCAATGRVFLWRFGRNEAVQQYRTTTASKHVYPGPSSSSSSSRASSSASSSSSPSSSASSSANTSASSSAGSRGDKDVSGINKIRFSGNSDRFGAVDCSGRLQLWHFATDPACRDPYACILCDAVSATDLAFLQGSSSVVATVGKHNKTSLCVWDTLLPMRSRLVAAVPGLGVSSGAISASTESGGITALLSLPPGGNERTLVAGGIDGSVKIFDMRMLSRGHMRMRSATSPWESGHKVQSGSRILSMSYCARSGRLATASKDGATFVWDNVLGGGGGQSVVSVQRGGSGGGSDPSSSLHQGVIWLENGKLLSWGENGRVVLYL
jgi:hypothetical protein